MSRIFDSLIIDALAAQFGVFPYAPVVSPPAPPLTPERAQEVLARQAEWEVRHRVADRPFGWGYICRDVGAELTDEEHTALQRFFDGDPRRPVITEMVCICAREDFLPENFST